MTGMALTALIVGAGSVGLTAALSLAQQGIDIRVVGAPRKIGGKH